MMHVIIIDGPNGAGKTTLIDQLTTTFEKDGMLVKHTSGLVEPYRKQLYDVKDQGLDTTTEEMEICIDSREVVLKDLHESIDDFDVYIIDRWAISSYIYQHLDVNTSDDRLISRFKNSQRINSSRLNHIYINVTCDADVIEHRVRSRDIVDTYDKYQLSINPVIVARYNMVFDNVANGVSDHLNDYFPRVDPDACITYNSTSGYDLTAVYKILKRVHDHAFVNNKRYC